MGRQTCKVMYAKYNSARRPDFRVTTEFCEDANGIFVRKRAAEAAAENHLENICKNSFDLQDYYRTIKVVPPEKVEGELRFSCIKGQTLAEQIEAQDYDKARFVARVNEALATVLSIQERYFVSFKMTDEFKAIFGEAELGEVPALNPANIDSLLTNFVVNDTGTYCIDCEWVCHFPVPFAFIKYRILLYLYVTQVHEMLNGTSLEEMLSWFGFSERECALYWKMDDHFQQCVHGEGRKYIYTSRYLKRELSIGYMEQQMQDREQIIASQAAIIQSKDNQIECLQREAGDSKAKIFSQEETIHSQDETICSQNAQIGALTNSYQIISNSFFWRMTKPARVTMDGIKRIIKKNETLYLFFRTLKDTLRHGVKYAKERRNKYLEDRDRIRKANSWPSEAEMAKQRGDTFEKAITFSVLVPLYNTPEKYLRAMIKSVQDQTYAQWELCLADGSDEAHSYVGEICEKLARKDKRIKYKKLESNKGISENTNACIEMSAGEYFALLDHDDVLHPSALYDNMKVICERDADFIYSDEGIFHEEISDTYYSHFKSDYAPDTLRSYNYICHLTVFKRTLLEEAGDGFRSRYDGSQDFDLVLRLTEKAKHIVHIPRVLYYWRSHSASVASSVGVKPYTIDAGKAALADHLARVGLKGTVMDSTFPSTYRIQYEIEGTPLVSIVIPNMDHVDDLKKCIDSISEKSTWKNWEIIIVENNSKNAETFEYYRSIDKRPEIRLVTWEGCFNFSAICNRGAQAAKGDYILLLNNDIEVITPDWLEQMLMFAQRDDVGAVGPMLYYPDNTIQHAGLIMGIGGSAGHSHKGLRRGEYGYLMRLTLAQDLSGVTGACCLVPRHVWEQIGGLDESFAVAFNDVDMCLRIRKAGYLIVWTPYAELYHYESKSRGYEDTPEKKKRFEGERKHLRDRWGDLIDAGDPYYNPNLTLDREDFGFR